MEYNFPDEIFQYILSYFHSSYKEPYHYKAMIDQDDFYFLTQRHKNAGLSYYYNLRFYDSGNLTYYLKIVLNSGRNSDAKNIVRFKKKGVAAKNIKSDFINIYKEYGDNKYLNGVINNNTPNLQYI
jgi:hypothetical protein